MRLVQVGGKRGRAAIQVPIAPVTVVMGPNESGKTTLLDLVTFGLEGPDRDRRPTATWSDLTFDDMRVSRSISFDQRGDKLESTHDVVVAARGESVVTKIRDAESQIARLVGRAWHWSPSEVIGSTGPERRKILAGILGNSLMRQRVQDQLAESECGFRALPASAKKHVDEDARALLRLPPEAGAEFAHGWLALLRKAKNAIQAECEAARAAVATAEGRVTDAGAQAGSRDAWTERIAGLTERELDLERQIAAAKAHAIDRVPLVEAHKAASKAYADKAGIQAATWKQQQDRDVCHETLEGATQGRTQAETTVATATTATATRLAEERAAGEAKNVAVTAQGRVGAAQILREFLVPLLEYAEEASFRAYGATAVLHPGDVARVQLAAMLDAPFDEFDRDAKAAREAHTRAVALLDAATRAEANARKRLEEIQRHEAKTRAEWEAADAVCKAADAAHAAAQAELPALADAAQAAADRIAALPTTSTAALDAQLDAVRAEKAEAGTTLARINDYGAITADRDRQVEASATLSADRNALHEAEKRAEAVVADLYAECVAPLTKPASEITLHVLGRELTISPIDGWSLGLDGVPVEHLSESATMILGIALHAAVQRIKPNGWRGLLVDGLEVIQEDGDNRRTRLLEALAEAQLDNVVVTCVSDGWKTPPLATVVQLHRESE